MLKVFDAGCDRARKSRRGCVGSCYDAGRPTNKTKRWRRDQKQKPAKKSVVSIQPRCASLVKVARPTRSVNAVLDQS